MAKLVRFFENLEVDSTGIELSRIVGGIRHLAGGKIEQIIVSSLSGDVTLLTVEVRYITGNSDRDKLVYLYESADISSGTFIDSSVDAPFSLHSKRVDGDLYLFVAAEDGTSCTLNIRVDFDINNISGL